jgi:hypothetical protein
MQNKTIEVDMSSALAMIISWGINNSILWTVIHGLFGWFYILYFAINR